MIVMMFYLIMLGNCFGLLARNQVDFDNLTEEEIEAIPYYGDTKFNQNWYALNYALDGPDSDAFGLGDGTMEM